MQTLAIAVRRLAAAEIKARLYTKVKPIPCWQTCWETMRATASAPQRHAAAAGPGARSRAGGGGVRRARRAARVRGRAAQDGWEPARGPRAPCAGVPVPAGRRHAAQPHAVDDALDHRLVEPLDRLVAIPLPLGANL